MTLDSMGTSISTSNKVCEEWYIHSSNSSWTNIVVTRNYTNRCITVQADLVSITHTDENAYIKLFQKFWVNPGQIYTIACSSREFSNNIRNVFPHTSGTNTVYLSTNEVYITSLAYATNEYSFGFLCSVSGNLAPGSTISFTIYEPCLYRGGFVNPNIVPDLTSIYTSRYLLNTDFYDFECNYRSVSGISKKAWINLVRIPKGNGGSLANHWLFHGKLGMEHSYNNGFPEIYEIEFAYAHRSGTVAGTMNTGYMIIPKVYRQTVDGLKFTKFRFAFEPNGEVVLQGYHNFTTSNAWNLWLDDFTNFNEGKDWLRRQFKSKDWDNIYNPAAIEAQRILSSIVITNVAHNDYTLIGNEVTTIEALTAISV